MLFKTLALLVAAFVACEAGLIHHEEVSDWIAYPKYEFKYGVDDHHTGDHKERSELRDGELVKQKYSWGEHDRVVKVAKVDHSHEVKIPVVHHQAVPVVTHHTVPVISHHVVPVVSHSLSLHHHGLESW